MKNYFIALSVVKRNANNEIEDTKVMNKELAAESISCLNDVSSFENAVKDDLIKSGYIDKDEKLEVTIINFRTFD